MKKVIIATSLFLSILSGSAFAEKGDLLIRFRALSIVPEERTTGTLDTVKSTLDNSYVPELDFTYMATDHIGVEVILATSRHELNSDLGVLGDVSVLPPSALLQYHFTPHSTFRPYVGIGINYTHFYHNDLNVGGVGVDIDNNQFGFVAQAGFDVAISKDWYINFDVKKMQLETTASLTGTSLGKLTIDPWIFGVGIGTKF